MSTGITLQVLINFLVIGLLPFIFFRRDGHFNLAWLATAAPFFVTSVALLLAMIRVIQPLAVPATALLPLLAVPLSALSVGLIGFTLGTHRVPLALWHQDNDAPRELVTRGAYARVRHPFYSAFLLAFVAACLVLPHGITLASTVYAAIAMTLTAKREEQRLATSEFGREYLDYMKQTGRFWPRLRGAAHD